MGLLEWIYTEPIKLYTGIFRETNIHCAFYTLCILHKIIFSSYYLVFYSSPLSLQKNRLYSKISNLVKRNNEIYLLWLNLFTTLTTFDFCPMMSYNDIIGQLLTSKMATSILLLIVWHVQILNGCSTWKHSISLSKLRKISLINEIPWIRTSLYSDFLNSNPYQSTLIFLLVRTQRQSLNQTKMISAVKCLKIASQTHGGEFG